MIPKKFSGPAIKIGVLQASDNNVLGGHIFSDGRFDHLHDSHGHSIDKQLTMDCC
jgi:hypothetical protein